MTNKEQETIINLANLLISHLNECEDEKFVDGVVCAVKYGWVIDIDEVQDEL